MNTLLRAVRNTSWRVKALVTMAAVAVIVPVAVTAWGPDRPTYDINNVADHITFNSITDNPNVGDERNFVTIKDASNTSAGGWEDDVTVEPGHDYLVRVYVHNNAASNLNLVATNTRVMANLPNTTGKRIPVEGFVTADNAQPQQIWDQAYFNSDQDFNLTYVNGSATMYNKVFPSGTQLSDGIVTSAGALVGYNAMDGNFPGCFNYSGYVTFKVKASTPQSANFKLTKEVSKHGANDWKKSYEAQPGETVDYLIEYKNTESAPQEDVVVKDTLPAGMKYVPGSTKYGTVAHPGGLTAPDTITSQGINIGTYTQGGGTWVMLSATVANNNQLPACGGNTLVNVARAETDFGYKEDTANVVVNKHCQPGETPPPVTELPQTGTTSTALTFIGLGVATAAAAYAVRSENIRKLFRG